MPYRKAPTNTKKSPELVKLVVHPGDSIQKYRKLTVLVVSCSTPSTSTAYRDGSRPVKSVRWITEIGSSRSMVVKEQTRHIYIHHHYSSITAEASGGDTNQLLHPSPRKQEIHIEEGNTPTAFWASLKFPPFLFITTTFLCIGFSGCLNHLLLLLFFCTSCTLLKRLWAHSVRSMQRDKRKKTNGSWDERRGNWRNINSEICRREEIWVNELERKRVVLYEPFSDFTWCRSCMIAQVSQVGQSGCLWDIDIFDALLCVVATLTTNSIAVPIAIWMVIFRWDRGSSDYFSRQSGDLFH